MGWDKDGAGAGTGGSATGGGAALEFRSQATQPPGAFGLPRAWCALDLPGCAARAARRSRKISDAVQGPTRVARFPCPRRIVATRSKHVFRGLTKRNRFQQPPCVRTGGTRRTGSLVPHALRLRIRAAGLSARSAKGISVVPEGCLRRLRELRSGF
jgi:hypothetical protein